LPKIAFDEGKHFELRESQTSYDALFDAEKRGIAGENRWFLK
jgi:hypothetical protein